MSQPLLTIAVTTYKRPDFLEQCLKSILNQEFKNYEVLVGNNDPDAPIDLSSLGIADSRIRVINREKNIGSLENAMDLLTQSSAKYFTWLADDDLYLKGFLSPLMKALDENPAAEIAFSSYQDGPSPDELVVDSSVADFQVLSAAQYLELYLGRKIKLIGNYGIWKRELLVKVGGMKRLGTGGSPYCDTLLAVEAGYAKCILFLPLPLVFFRTHQASHSWTSQDLSGYATAQADLFRYSENVFQNTDLAKDRLDRVRYDLLSHWCLSFFGAVACRSKELQFRVWPSYCRWLMIQCGKLTFAKRTRVFIDFAKMVLRVCRSRIEIGLK